MVLLSGGHLSYCDHKAGPCEKVFFFFCKVIPLMKSEYTLFTSFRRKFFASREPLSTHQRLWTLTLAPWLLPESQRESQTHHFLKGKQVHWKLKTSKLKNKTFFIIVSFFHVSMPLNNALVDVPAKDSISFFNQKIFSFFKIYISENILLLVAKADRGTIISLKYDQTKNRCSTISDN